MTRYSTQSHHPDTEPTYILLIPSAWLGSNKYQFLSHFFDSTSVWKGGWNGVGGCGTPVFPKPSQSGTYGSSTLNLPHANLGIPYTDLKHHINKYITLNWQDEWNDAGSNKLHSVKPVLEECQSSYKRSRRDDIILRHSHVGHLFRVGTIYLSLSTTSVY